MYVFICDRGGRTMNPVYTKIFSGESSEALPMIWNLSIVPNSARSIFVINAGVEIVDAAAVDKPSPFEGIGFGRHTSCEVGGIISDNCLAGCANEVADVMEYCLRKHVDVRLKREFWNDSCARGIMCRSSRDDGGMPNCSFIETSGIRALTHIHCVDGRLSYYLTRIETKNSYFVTITHFDNTLRDLDFSSYFDEYSNEIRSCNVWHRGMF